MSRKVFELILKVHRELPPRTAFGRVAVETYIEGLLLLLLRHFAKHRGTRATLARKQTHIQPIHPLFQYVAQRHSARIEVADAACLYAMSPSHFMRFFKQTNGQSFRAYLSTLRIAKA